MVKVARLRLCPKKEKDRKKNTWYLHRKFGKVFWDGRGLLCTHLVRRERCKDCGTGHCEHDNQTQRCRECGNGYCKHGKQKAQCRQCNPRAFCKHNRLKDRCRDCGTGLCKHNRMKGQCRDCGTGYCKPHGVLKSVCRVCNPSGHLAALMRARAWKACKAQDTTKTEHTMDMVGCSKAALREHLEKQFTDRMTWENQGKDGWHIDHRRPCASFDLTDPEQQRMCFHFSNLQPMWGVENLEKAASFDPETFTHTWTGDEWEEKC